MREKESERGASEILIVIVFFFKFIFSVFGQHFECVDHFVREMNSKKKNKKLVTIIWL